MFKEKDSVLVIFKENLSEKEERKLRNFTKGGHVISSIKLRDRIESLGIKWKSLDSLVDGGNIYEANELLKELSLIKNSDGIKISKSFIYKGYELWWINYNNLFLYFTFPYTRYKRFLEHLKNFQKVYLFEPPFKSLFSCYLRANKIDFSVVDTSRSKVLTILPFGIIVQIVLTLISIPFLVLLRQKVMMFTGDKFEKSKDYDFRMKFLYEELRKKKIPFVEFIRSLESWKNIIVHAVRRRRPVIYPEAIVFVARFLSYVSFGHIKSKKLYGSNMFIEDSGADSKFESLVSTQYLRGVYGDVWAIRITKWLLTLIGVKSSIIMGATERNFHAIIGSKLNKIPTTGVLHGFASSNYNVYDFQHTFDGEKSFSLDKYGLWSDWWKEYYLKNGNAYKENQLFVSGPMRPFDIKDFENFDSEKSSSVTKVLFVPGELAPPEEVFEYLLELMKQKDFSVHLTFRPYRDQFENWMKENKPKFLEEFDKDKILLGNIHNCISKCDVVVGTYSTAALEALFHLKPVLLFKTSKWGDYFDLKEYKSEVDFYNESPEKLVESINRSKNISKDELLKLQSRFFGNPKKNGSKWVVDEVERDLQTKP